MLNDKIIDFPKENTEINIIVMVTVGVSYTSTVNLYDRTGDRASSESNGLVYR